MYKILFFAKKNGRSAIGDYLLKLKNSRNKKDHDELKKIQDYIKILSERGIGIGEPYVKHIRGKIWELRPADNRILFAVLIEAKFLLLSIFKKKTNKTPKKEIDKALQDLDEYLKGGK